MLDIAMCSNGECPLRARCYRHEAKADPVHQCYGLFAPDAQGNCEYFIPIEDRRVEELVAAAEDVVKRWDSPEWKWDQHTGVFISRLRDAAARVKP